MYLNVINPWWWLLNEFKLNCGSFSTSEYCLNLPPQRIWYLMLCVYLSCHLLYWKFFFWLKSNFIMTPRGINSIANVFFKVLSKYLKWSEDIKKKQSGRDGTGRDGWDGTKKFLYSPSHPLLYTHTMCG